MRLSSATGRARGTGIAGLAGPSLCAHLVRIKILAELSTDELELGVANVALTLRVKQLERVLQIGHLLGVLFEITIVDLAEGIEVNLPVARGEHAIHIAADQRPELRIGRVPAERLQRVFESRLSDLALTIGVEEVECSPHAVLRHDC